jgi:transmembrane sensor
MTHNNESSSSVSDQASAWFARLQADDVSAEERRLFQEWYQSHPQHAEAYDRTRKLWMLLEMPAERVHSRIIADQSGDATANSAAVIPGKNSPDAGNAEASLTTRHHRIPFAAACCLSVLLTLAVWQLPLRMQDWESDYHTAPGEQFSVNLEDGSRLTLNTDTALSVNFDAQQRQIELLRGEAYFEVAPNKARPFIVNGGRANARAVGTAFSVRKHDDDMRVAVNEGTVEVRADTSSTLVKVSQQVDYTHGRLEEVLNVENDDSFAWRRGQVVFNHQSLSQVLVEINRYRSGRIVAVEGDLAGRIISGVFDSRDADAVVDALKTTLHANTLSLPGGLVLLF